MRPVILDDRLEPVASHGPDGGGRQLVRTFPCEEDRSSRWIGQDSSEPARPGGPTDRTACSLGRKALVAGRWLTGDCKG